ncbi:ATP synthase subunit d, mitochondrial-like, partial [Teleopsis dalmanni]
LVDNFQKQYEAIQIPYPKDNLGGQIESQIKETKTEIEAFKKGSETRIVDYQKKISHLSSLLPYGQMTMEDYRDAFPESALDPINRPTFWPHNPEEQLDYQSKEQEGAGH